MRCKYLLLFSLLLWPTQLAAQRGTPASEITVLASGQPQPRHLTGTTVDIVTAAELERSQDPDVAALLERFPGVTLTRNGGPGGFTGISVRGAPSEQLLVIVDGVRVADPASPGGGFDFGNLLLGNLARIELQRSSNSTIWGSDAIGGVVLLETGGEGAASGIVEYGARDTLHAVTAVTLRRGSSFLNLGGGHFQTEGFSAAAAGTEPDGFRQDEVSGRGRLELARGFGLFASGRYADGRAEIDGFPAPTFELADTAEYQDTRQGSGAAGLAYERGKLAVIATGSFARTERENFDPAAGAGPTFSGRGDSRRIELRGRWGDLFESAAGPVVQFGAEREWSRYRTLCDGGSGTATNGAYAQLGWNAARWHVAAGLRRDEHRDFGGQWSFGADGAAELGRVRLSASYGEGFKSPTLFQLRSDFGNALLRPERSRGFEVGAKFRAAALELGLTAFRRDTYNLINFVSCFAQSTGICAQRPFGTYDNLGRTRAQGVEASVAAHPRRDLALRAAYTYLDATDRTPGSATYGAVLARRPHHTLSAAAEWAAIAGVRLGADLRWVSDRFDDAANGIPLESYAVVGLRGEWDAGGMFTLFGRIENAFDKSYQTAAGYASARRGVFVGVRGRQ
jgi:vitamin B12 transporter